MGFRRFSLGTSAAASRRWGCAAGGVQGGRRQGVFGSLSAPRVHQFVFGSMVIRLFGTFLLAGGERKRHPGVPRKGLGEGNPSCISNQRGQKLLQPVPFPRMEVRMGQQWSLSSGYTWGDHSRNWLRESFAKGDATGKFWRSNLEPPARAGAEGNQVGRVWRRLRVRVHRRAWLLV